MRIDFKFRHLAASDELTNYVVEKVERLQKYELKPVRLEVTFSAEKSSCTVTILVRGLSVEIHAQTEADNFFAAVDIALEKVARQLARKKAKVKARYPKVS